MIRRAKGKWIAFWAVTAGLVILVLFAIVNRDRLLEGWYIRQLDSSDPRGRVRAARELGKLHSEQAVPRLGKLARKGGEGEKVALEALLEIRGEGLNELISIMNADEDGLSPSVAAMLIDSKLPVEDLASRLLDRLTRGGSEVDIWVLGNILKEAGESASRLLSRNLEKGTPEARLTVVLALGELGLDREMMASLALRAVGDEDSQVRAAALGLLADLRVFNSTSDLFVKALVEALGDGSPDVRRIAAAAMGWMESAGGATLEALAGVLEDEDPEVARQAARALLKLDEPALLRILRSGPTRSRKITAQLLGDVKRIGAVKIFAEILRGDLEPELRDAVIDALGLMGEMARAAVPALCEELERAEGEYRYGLVRVLGEIGPGAVEAVPTLVQALEDEDTGLRQRAALALRALGVQAAPAVPALIEQLRDREVAGFAADALGAIGPAALPPLLHLLSDEDASIRLAATEALLKTGSAEVVPALAKLIEDPDEHVRYLVLSGLHRLPREADIDAHPGIVRALKDEQPAIRFLAAKLVVESGGETARQAIPALLEIVKDEELVIPDRLEALAYIAKVEGGAQVEALKEALKTEEAAVRRGAAEALGELGPAARKAVAELRAAARDPDEGVRQEARQAIRKIAVRPEGSPDDADEGSADGRDGADRDAAPETSSGDSRS